MLKLLEDLNETNLVSDIKSINISGEADESLLVTIGSIEKQRRINISLADTHMYTQKLLT